MPSFAETIMQEGMKSAGEGPDIMGGIKAGSELAQHAENIKTQRANIELQKEKLGDARLENFGTAFEKMKNFTGKSRNGYLKYLKSYRDALNLQDKIDDDTFDFVTTDDEAVQGRLNTLLSDRRNGKIENTQMFSILQDRSKFADLEMTPDIIKRIEEADKVAVENRVELNKQQNSINATRNNEAVARDEAGNVELRKQTGKAFQTFEAKGGIGHVNHQIAILERAKKMLADKTVETGGKIATAASMFGSTGVALYDKQMKAMQDDVKKGINLKENLDAQFAAREADMQYEMRGVDPKLDNKQNIRKIQDTIDGLKISRDNAVNTYVQHGHVPKGYRPSINRELVPPESGMQLPPGIDAEKFKLKSPAEQQRIIKLLQQKAGSK